MNQGRQLVGLMAGIALLIIGAVLVALAPLILDARRGQGRSAAARLLLKDYIENPQDPARALRLACLDDADLAQAIEETYRSNLAGEVRRALLEILARRGSATALRALVTLASRESDAGRLKQALVQSGAISARLEADGDAVSAGRDIMEEIQRQFFGPAAPPSLRLLGVQILSEIPARWAREALALGLAAPQGALAAEHLCAALIAHPSPHDLDVLMPLVTAGQAPADLHAAAILIQQLQLSPGDGARRAELEARLRPHLAAWASASPTGERAARVQALMEHLTVKE
ncbi:MAG: hypothetical protein HY718_15675 [Planctomycetes bacterium]|nr:hypothetical protein [Planctomycetota bacterium]